VLRKGLFYQCLIFLPYIISQKVIYNINLINQLNSKSALTCSFALLAV